MSFRIKNVCLLLVIIATQVSISPASTSASIFGPKCSKICGITTDVPTARRYRFKRSTDDGSVETTHDEYVDDEYVDDDNNEYDGTDIHSDEARIVNGYKAKNRPWLVLMFPRGGLCGGVLINNLFVLSAAHCYCRMDNTAIRCKEGKVNGKPTSIPQYDVSKLVKMYIGVNGKDMKKVMKDQSLINYPSKVWIREGWVIGKGFSPDLSLAKLSKPVKFQLNFAAPICIPTEEDTMTALKEKNPVFVAGWGASFSACDTNDSGPSPNTMCKFPFEHNGKTHNYCVHEPTPAEMDPDCKAFFDWSKKTDINVKRQNEGGESIPVKVLTGKGKHKYCFDTGYNPKGNEMGWCGTCYHGVNEIAQEGQEGFCDPFNPMRAPLPSETSKPKTDQNWGMCASWCRPNSSQSAAEQLMETSLELLDFDVCNVLGGDLAFDDKREICAGNKKFFPVIDVFKKTTCRRRRRRHRRNKRSSSNKGACYKKEPTTSEVYDYNIKSKFDYYLGGSDSCQGDSGGPLVAFLKQGKDMRAFTLGAVSRGTGCANLNEPGIFSKVSFHIDWIKKTAGEGSC